MCGVCICLFFFWKNIMQIFKWYHIFKLWLWCLLLPYFFSENLLLVLFLVKTKQKREDIHFNLRGSCVGSKSINHFKSLRIFSAVKGMLNHLLRLELRPYIFIGIKEWRKASSIILHGVLTQKLAPGYFFQMQIFKMKICV